MITMIMMHFFEVIYSAYQIKSDSKKEGPHTAPGSPGNSWQYALLFPEKSAIMSYI